MNQLILSNTFFLLCLLLLSSSTNSTRNILRIESLTSRTDSEALFDEKLRISREVTELPDGYNNETNNTEPKYSNFLKDTTNKDNLLKKDIGSDHLNQRYQQSINFSNNFINKYFFSKGDCNSKSCINGKCITSDTCKCKLGYTKNAQGFLCDYKMKKQKLALLLETLTFGFGHIYTEKYALGLTKFFLFLIVAIATINSDLIDRIKLPGIVKSIKVAYFLLLISCITWYSIDLFLFGHNYYYDGNNIPLIPIKVSSYIRI